MIDIDWSNIISEKWLSLIGRPRLSLFFKNKKLRCGNITCSKNDRFKLYKENNYLCECGFEIKGKFEIEKFPIKLKCCAKSCPENKNKIDKYCIRCSFIKEI